MNQTGGGPTNWWAGLRQPLELTAAQVREWLLRDAFTTGSGGDAGLDPALQDKLRALGYLR